ncbi:hypothetical protein T310_0773 [Rasamsonia emersonii CBS 393.64]|uniref:Uncharacterized protein n=1 Tax=Rasamsonia emersonii (strain ATCC 16479 / CBS 393.64 / IMI 116815) TaxID=1408163 RepID=A0A0F4Z3V6_RASE3|nr:hypothetical protein T310_0773 [Rasamsonia emersonii CBS 393.64]KKA25182.1 hypothetical protein T310_0773 [Rasamsonia emersonii CBS 393.64]
MSADGSQSYQVGGVARYFQGRQYKNTRMCMSEVENPTKSKAECWIKQLKSYRILRTNLNNYLVDPFLLNLLGDSSPLVIAVESFIAWIGSAPFVHVHTYLSWSMDIQYIQDHRLKPVCSASVSASVSDY